MIKAKGIPRKKVIVNADTLNGRRIKLNDTQTIHKNKYGAIIIESPGKMLYLHQDDFQSDTVN